MAETETIEKEVLIDRVTGDEQQVYLLHYPIAAESDQMFLKVYRLAYGQNPVQLTKGTQYRLNDRVGRIEFGVELDEDSQIYVTGYDYEPVYYKYLNSFRAAIGDTDFLNLRYGYNLLIDYFHKAIFEKVVPIATGVSGWTFGLDSENRLTSPVDDIKLGFMVSFASLMLQKAELRAALRRAIVIEDKSSKLDTTRALRDAVQFVEKEEKRLDWELDQYLTTGAMADGTLPFYSVSASMSELWVSTYNSPWFCGSSLTL
jgi:hypothetical protein